MHKTPTLFCDHCWIRNWSHITTHLILPAVVVGVMLRDSR